MNKDDLHKEFLDGLGDEKTINKHHNIWEKEEQLYEEAQKKSKIHKYIKIFFTIIFITLLLFVFTFYSHFDVLIGKISLSSIEEGVLEFKNFTIYFENNTNNKLEELYQKHQSLNGFEIAACLSGSVDENTKTYNITTIHLPEIYSQRWNQVVYGGCPKDTLIMFHTHPENKCIASDVDLTSFLKNKKSNRLNLMMIMCNKNTYRMYN
jgi:proteasome lid subunit RPN8/RPN11